MLCSVRMAVRKSWRSRLGAHESWLKAAASIVVIGGALFGLARWIGASWVDHRADARIDGRVSKLVDQQIGNSPKLDDILTKLSGINERLSKMEGWKEGVEARVKILGEKQDGLLRRNDALSARLDQQTALASLNDPERALGTIRREIELSGMSARLIPDAQLVEYENAIRPIPRTASRYWETVYALVNYVSAVRQQRGLVPDPAKTARPCPATSGKGNMFLGGPITDCVVNLGTQIFEDVVFRNCVIRYSEGDSFILDHVEFINCTFVFQPGSAPVNAKIQKLLLAILDSQNQQDVVVTIRG